ncbi:MAG: FAD-dependent monooxygenase [Rhodospirillaceae bacterium]|nr:FAD-dependent monooxygenase [Rhodospirillaceae bacterium]
MAETRIAIIGAGIGGLTCALALQRRGFRPMVFEQAPQLGEIGAGLTIPPNATHGLEDVGLGDGLARLASRPYRQGVIHYRTGDVLVDQVRGDQPMQAYGAHYYQIHRADLHGLLAAAVAANDGAAVHLSHAFAGLDHADSSVTVRFANGRSVTADAVIGADGIKSEVRAALWGRVPPRFTGNVAWRGLVPVDRLPPGLKIDPPSGAIVGNRHSMARYLIRDGTLVNYAAFAAKSGWEEEGWSVRSEVSELLDEFHDWHASIRDVLAATPPELCFKWALHDRDPLPRWSRGRVTLLGDAAHPMLPFLGMGAAMGIEDGVVLARCFAAGGSVGDIFARYEAARRPRADFVLLASRAAQDRLMGNKADGYTQATHRNEEAMGLFAYNPATAAI